jgi:hypothetical protein
MSPEDKTPTLQLNRLVAQGVVMIDDIRGVAGRNDAGFDVGHHGLMTAPAAPASGTGRLVTTATTALATGCGKQARQIADCGLA